MRVVLSLLIALAYLSIHRPLLIPSLPPYTSFPKSFVFIFIFIQTPKLTPPPQLFNTTHTIIGTALLALFLIQPLFGILHHILYRRTQSRTPVSHIHIWYGRALMVVAVVNGGLGLKLARPTGQGSSYTVVYSVVAGLVGHLGGRCWPL